MARTSLRRLHGALAEPRVLVRRGDERALTRANLPPAMLTSTPLAEPVRPENALQIADAYACVRALADAAASLPLIAYRRTDSGRVRFDGRTPELLRTPAPAVTQAGLVGQMVAHLNVYGNCYVGKFRDADGHVDQLALLHPELVTPELKAGRPRYAVSDGRGRATTHGTDDICHIKALTTDGLVGLSPVRQARVALSLSQTLTHHARLYFENDARPAGIIKLDGPASQEQLESAAAQWGESHQGWRNAHRTAVVTGSFTFTPISVPPEDQQFLEQRKLSATEVARIFRVPPWIIGADAGSSMTYSNVEQQSLQFVTYSLRPWLVAIEQALSADTDLFARGQYCEFLIDGMLRADSSTRADVYTKALDPVTGWMNRDEVRRLENLEPEPAPPAPAVSLNGNRLENVNG